jgi:glucose/arabinose dehydrogenase
MMKEFCMALAIGLVANVDAFAAPSVRDPNLTVTEVVSGLSTPTTMAFIGSDDFLILQKNDGKVRRVIAGVLQPNAVLDVNVDSAAERGLLGITVHPNFPMAPFVYLYFTESSTAGDSSGSPAGNRIYRYTWNGATLTDPALIIDLPVIPGPNHDGGIITFGPDGMLYGVIGDLNRNGQLQNNASGAAPDDTSVILRLNEDGSVPGDNPFFSQAGNLAKYYAYGIRNSFGLTFDPLTEKMWMTENGPTSYDEINLVEPGFNSGWNQLMGPDSRNSKSAADLFPVAGSRYDDPKFSWLNPVGPTAISFLNSTLLGTAYLYDVFVGDINNGNLYRLTPNATRDGFVFSGEGLADLVADSAAELDEVIFGTGFGGISDVKVGPDGLLYIVSLGEGKVYMISAHAAALTLGTTSLPPAEVGVAFNMTLDITGGAPPYTLSIVTGALPPGLSLVSAAVTGTPTGRSSRFMLHVTDQAGASVTRRFKIPVRKAVIVKKRRLANAKVGRSYKARLVAGKGLKPYTWSVLSGTLPSGLTFDSATGLITGDPIAPTRIDLTFQVTDALGGTAEKTLTLTVQ